MNYIIPFWTMIGLVFTVFGIIIWLSVLKSKDNNALNVGYEAIRSVVEQYLSRSFQKIVYASLSLYSQEAKEPKGMNVRLQMYNEKWKTLYVDVMSKNILYFARGQEICKSLLLQNKLNSIEQINVCMIPDVIIQRIGAKYYYDLLNFVSKVIFNNNNGFDKYSNDEAREYIFALMNECRKRKENSNVTLDG